MPPFADYWHLPGSFIIKNETMDQCIRRILKDELGLGLKDIKPELLGVFEDIDKDPRGHVIEIIYGIELNDKLKPKPVGLTKEAKFFKKLPPHIGFNNKETLVKLGYP